MIRFYSFCSLYLIWYKYNVVIKSKETKIEIEWAVVWSYDEMGIFRGQLNDNS